MKKPFPLPSRAAMVKAIDGTLIGIHGLGHDLDTLRKGKKNTLAAAKDNDVYEAYLMMLAANALSSAGAAHFEAVPSSRALTLRRGPGVLRATPVKFSYIRFEIKGKRFELHVGTEIKCRSGDATVEADIFIVSENHAERVRASTNQHPHYRRAKLIIEAKYFENSISTVVARSYVGHACRGMSAGCIEALACSGGIDKNARKLIELGYPPLHCFENERPGISNRLATYLDAAFRKNLWRR